MTKKEALIAMENGQRVTHFRFLEGVFYWLDDDILCDQYGNMLGPIATTFQKIILDKLYYEPDHYKEGWIIYEEKSHLELIQEVENGKPQWEADMDRWLNRMPEKKPYNPLAMDHVSKIFMDWANDRAMKKWESERPKKEGYVKASIKRIQEIQKKLS